MAAPWEKYAKQQAEVNPGNTQPWVQPEPGLEQVSMSSMGGPPIPLPTAEQAIATGAGMVLGGPIAARALPAAVEGAPAMAPMVRRMAGNAGRFVVKRAGGLAKEALKFTAGLAGYEALKKSVTGK